MRTIEAPRMDVMNANAQRAGFEDQVSLFVRAPLDQFAEPRREERRVVPQVFHDAFVEKEIIEGMETDVNGRFLQPERPMDLEWSSFDQIWLGKEVMDENGEAVYRIAAVSMPKAAGSGHRMGEEGLRKTLGVDENDVQRWKGDKEGTLIAMRKDLPPGEIDLSIIKRFIENSGEVVAKRHPFPDHPAVKKFFDLQEVRRKNLSAIEERVQRVLSSDEFIGMAAMTEEQMGAGAFVLELEIRKGVLWGADPKGKRMELRKIMKGKAHGQWGEWAEQVGKRGGNFVYGHGDDSEWVSSCDGSETCSKFFDIMQSSPNATVLEEKTIFENNQYKTLFILPTFESSVRRETSVTCSKHKTSIGECGCNGSETAAVSE